MATAQEQVTAAEGEDGRLLADKERTEEAPAEGQTDDGLSGLPVDRGWAWMILVGAVLEAFVFGGILKTSGVFFVRFQQRFDSSASETTLVHTVFNIIISVAGIFVMTLGMKYMTTRTSVFIGAILTSLAYGISAFARHILVLFLTLGAIAGLSAAMVYLPIISTLGIYFYKYRGMANSVTMAGGSLGALVFGPLYSMLFDHYGYTGTMIVAAGILLNILVSACLLRPPEFYSTRNKSPSDKCEQNSKAIDTTKETPRKNGKLGESCNVVSANKIVLCSARKNDVGDLNENSAAKPKDHIRLPLRISRPPSSEAAHGDLLSDPNGTRTRAHTFDNFELGDKTSSRTENSLPETYLSARKRTVSESNRSLDDSTPLDKTRLALYSNTDVMCGSLVSLRSETIKTNHANSSHDNEVSHVSKTSIKASLSVVRSQIMTFLRTVFDPSLLKDRVFIHFTIFSFVSFAPAVITPVYFVPLAKDIGISTEQINVLLVLFGCTDFIVRVCVGIFADRKWLKSTTIVGLAFAIMCVIHNLTRLIQSFWSMVVFVVVQSSLTGVYIALFAVILVENIGLEKFKSGLGFTNMWHGASGALFFPVTGALRDVSGAYYWSYHMLSFLLLVGAILAFTLPLSHRRRQKQASPEICVDGE